jgi:hypothetical protein
MKNKLIIGGILVTVALGGGASIVLNDKPKEIKLENPQKVQWDKPTTDAEWAEDVKAEQFDIRSTEKLEEMSKVHTEKLKQITKTGAKLVECPDCARYEIKQNLLNEQEQGTEFEEDIETLTEKTYQEQLAQYQYDIETLTRSVERMNEELRLREKGFVEVKEKGDKERSKKPEELTREIYD